MNPIKKKLMIFDLDGTLSDTLGAIAEAVNLTLAHFGYPQKEEDAVRRAIGSGARMLVKRLMPEKEAENEERVTEVLAHYNKSYGEIYMHTTEMYPGVGETVRLLARMGVKIAVYSNKQDAYVKDLVSMYFPNGEVSVARGQTDIPVKPDPAGVRLILGELGATADESIFVGDSGVDLKTAENSGMDFIGVAWGFCGRDALAEMGAKVIIDEPSEIMNLVK